jgi:RAT1-interacting protein
MEIMSFSYDSDRRVHMDDRSLKYYHPPSLPISLSSGYPDRFIERDDSQPEKLDALLHSLLKLRPASLQRSLIPQTQVITWRGIMTKIMVTPYSQRDPWCFCVTRFQGTLYMHEPPELKSNDANNGNDTSSGDRRFADRPSLGPGRPSHHEMMYWGYRFETLSTLDRLPSEYPTPSSLEEACRHRVDEEVVNTNVQYCSVVKTKLGNHALILGAEVDCTRHPKLQNDPNRYYMELKTSKVCETERDRRSFERFKLLKCYIQSFLVAVPTIVFGWRDKGGQLVGVEEMETLKMPRMVRDKGYWDPNVCLNFANSFLDWLQSEVKEDGRLHVYRVQYDPSTLSVSVLKEQVQDDEAHVVIPPWYASAIEGFQ